MHKFIKLATADINIIPLLQELAQNGQDVWKEDTYLRDYPQGPFGDTESIILRFTTRTVKELEACNRTEVVQNECVWQDVASKFPAHKQVVLNLAYAMGATRIGRVMINKLKDGGRIYRHPDTPDHAKYWCRFHVVIGALPGVTFTCDDESVEMQTGDVYFFRNEYPHEVVNNSGAPRIHMIIDLRVEELKPGTYPLEGEQEKLDNIWQSYIKGLNDNVQH